MENQVLSFHETPRYNAMNMRVYEMGGIKIGITIPPTGNVGSFSVYSSPLNQQGVEKLQGFLLDKLPPNTKMQKIRTSGIDQRLAKQEEHWQPLFRVSIEIGHDREKAFDAFGQTLSALEVNRGIPDFSQFAQPAQSGGMTFP